MGFWFRSWSRYDRIGVYLTQSSITQRGFAAWCILTFSVAASFVPARRWNSELFSVTHLVAFTSFVGTVWLHVSDEVKAYVWVPIGLSFFDRLLRVCNVLYLNLNVIKGKWATKAKLTPLPGNATRVTIEALGTRKAPGQHILISCHAIVPLQNHSFTIASLPSL